MPSMKKLFPPNQPVDKSLLIQYLVSNVESAELLRGQEVPDADGQVIYLRGLSSANDGGGGVFFYSKHSRMEDDGGTILKPRSGIGNWIRESSGPINVRWFGAKGDGQTDDTVAINRAINAASVQRKSVFVPTGVYLVGQLLFGNQSLTGQSSSPLGFFGEGWGSTLKAKNPGSVIQAWSIAGVHFSNFDIDGNGIATTCIDTSWKSGVGPSCNNKYEHIRCRGSTGVIWKAINNNDCSFDQCIIIGNGHNQIGLDLTASGGLAWIRDSVWNNCYLRFGCQNGTIQNCWGMGIQFASGCLNYVLLNGLYLYWNTHLGAILKSNSFQNFQSVRALTCLACQFIGPSDLISNNQGFLDLNLYSSLELQSCQFHSESKVNLFGINCRGDSFEKPVVRFKGGSLNGNVQSNLNSKIEIQFENVLNDATGYFIRI